jgi:hypothetical protein
VNAKQLVALLRDIDLSQRAAARRLDINERTMRKYVAGDAPVPRTVELALVRLRIDQEHEMLLAEMDAARGAMSAPFAQTNRKLRAIAEGRSRENPTIEEIRTASEAMDRFEKARLRLRRFFEENKEAYTG